METKVIVAIPQPSIDFNFHSNCSSPYITAPSSPQPFSTTSSSLQPNENFEFNFTGQLQRPSISADELFHGGKILPLNLIQEPASSNQQHKIQKQRSSSFSVPSIESKTRSESSDSDDVFSNENIKTSSSSSSSSFSSFFSFSKGYRKWRLKDFLLFRSVSEGRGRERKRYTVLCKTTAYDDVNSSSFRSIENSGSVSKNRGPVSAHELHYTPNRAAPEGKTMLCKTTAYDDVNNSSFRSIENSGSVSKRRGPVSAHELHYTLNRAASEDLKRKTVLCKTTAYDDVNNSSFRSIENSGSVSKRRGPVSAHELHYTLNRAASEELKRKTMLPYKQGLLGCLGLNHGASMHSISRRFGSMERA